MKRSFSFSEKPVTFLLHRFPSLLPGIETVISIYYDIEYERLNAEEIRKENDKYLQEEITVNDKDGKIQKLRRDSSPFLWMQAEEIPFETKIKEKNQISIFNELNNNVLLLRHLNETDGLHDLFFIYFNKNLSNFGIGNSTKSLSTENKTIIGHLLKYDIETAIKNFREDRELFVTLSQNNQTIINELSQTRKDLSITREKYKDGIYHLCRSYLLDLSRKYDQNFTFSEEAIKKLKEYDGNLEVLSNIIEKAVHYAQTMKLFDFAKDIVISDYHLIFDVTTEKKSAEKVQISDQIADIPARYNKSFLFLNKLEYAAQSVKSKNLLLTSANVGNEFPSPITPSAITDALKNHQSKILFLFKELPNHWQIIRSEFRPVQNILNPKQDRHKRTG